MHRKVVVLVHCIRFLLYVVLCCCAALCGVAECVTACMCSIGCVRVCMRGGRVPGVCVPGVCVPGVYVRERTEERSERCVER